MLETNIEHEYDVKPLAASLFPDASDCFDISSDFPVKS